MKDIRNRVLCMIMMSVNLISLSCVDLSMSMGTYSIAKAVNR